MRFKVLAEYRTFFKKVLTYTEKTCIIIQVAERYGNGQQAASLEWQALEDVAERFGQELLKRI